MGLHQNGFREPLLGTLVVYMGRLVGVCIFSVLVMGWIIANSGRTFINEDGEEMINACDHVFDCIEMGQGYHFHKGEVLWDASVG